ncbi:hypothetical protein CLF_108167 [Clonorchis sinensis]|uniref:Uncharacterized protein n=1 Tax=Clonorchis sinensis TaxID=79923 RepID=H2KS59_CLOSI|nr:hypothetical protein CLF_108167 [Clonorchis sinensis]
MSDMNYTHETVDHTENFVDPTTGAHTQTIESLRHVYKMQNKRQCGTHRSLVDSYLCEFVWRQRSPCNGNDTYFGKTGRHDFRRRAENLPEYLMKIVRQNTKLRVIKCRKKTDPQGTRQLYCGHARAKLQGALRYSTRTFDVDPGSVIGVGILWRVTHILTEAAVAIESTKPCVHRIFRSPTETRQEELKRIAKNSIANGGKFSPLATDWSRIEVVKTNHSE